MPYQHGIVNDQSYEWHYRLSCGQSFPLATVANRKSDQQGESPFEGYLRHRETGSCDIPHEYGVPKRLKARRNRSGFVVELGFFDGHIFEFTGFEDFAAFQTLHEFGVFLASNNLHARVLTWGHGGFSRDRTAVGLKS